MSYVFHLTTLMSWLIVDVKVQRQKQTKLIKWTRSNNVKCSNWVTVFGVRLIIYSASFAVVSTNLHPTPIRHQSHVSLTNYFRAFINQSNDSGTGALWCHVSFFCFILWACSTTWASARSVTCLHEMPMKNNVGKHSRVPHIHGLLIFYRARYFRASFSHTHHHHIYLYN